MADLGFNDSGYEYLNKENRVLFSEDDAHNKLFEYITADISPISKLLERHFLTQMNLDTFELTSGRQIGTELSEIRTILAAAHPYYQYEVDKSITRAIGKYFNQLLVYSIWGCQNLALKHEVTKSWYKERLFALMPVPLYQRIDDDGLDDFLTEYEKQIGEWNSVPSEETTETVVFDIPQKPIPFSSEINTQKEVANILYFTLDVDAEYINKLSPQQRIWLYGNVCRAGNLPMLNVTEEIRFYQQPRLSSSVDSAQQDRESQELKELFSPLYSLGQVNVERHGIPANIQGPLASAVEFCRGITTPKSYEVYDIENLRQLLFLEIIRMIQSKKMIRKCRNCGKYFIIKNRKIVYCNRIDKSGRKCSEVGPTRSYHKKMDEDEALKIYNRAYKTHFARRKNGILSQNGFQEWCKAAKSKLDKVRDGELDIKEFQDWLKK